MEKPIYNLRNETSINKNDVNITRSIYNAVVTSIDDDIDGGRIKARITGLDNKFVNADIPWSYPLIPRMIHMMPKVGEVVRIIIEDTKYPYNMRYWTGSVISQHQKINFDSYNTALSTTPVSPFSPDKSIYKIPTAKGVFPELSDIAIIGRVNTDVILKDNNVLIRAGKHISSDITQLNEKNPAIIQIGYNQNLNNNQYESSTVIFSDKIALISHTGNPNFKSTNLTTDDINNLLSKSHPMVRGDVLLQILQIFRNAIIQHIHGYSNLPADKNSIITMLEKINIENILQKNIVIN